MQRRSITPSPRLSSPFRQWRPCQPTSAQDLGRRSTCSSSAGGDRSDHCSGSGKALKFARAEADRGIQTFTFAAEEAKRIHGETVPLDATPAGATHMGFYLRVPVGVVVAISPFNFPLNLVAHKVAPALAVGNTVVLKPATTTPLTSVILGEILVEAGLPAGALNIIFGDGRTVGDQLVTDPRPAKVTFTGSPPVGRHIMSRAGLKKVTLELGNSSPTIIDHDADLTVAVPKCGGKLYNSGQVCLSVQRIYVQRSIEKEFTERRECDGSIEGGRPAG
jgi:acyl-CoA reductase-like NAD-dependent aldehyde dehydrogenase